MSDDKADAAADEAEAPDDPRLRRGENDAAVNPNPRSFLTEAEHERWKADAAAADAKAEA